MELTETKRKLYLLADRTVMNMKNHIRRAGKFNTGQLYNSVGWKVVQGGIEFYVKAPYSQYVIMGRRKGAKRPPFQAILKWIETPHGNRALANIRRKWSNTTKEGAAFIICRSISEKGIKPVDFYNPAINTLYKTDSWHLLEAAFVNDIEKDLEKNINVK